MLQESKMWLCDDCQVSRDGIPEALPLNLASKLVSYYNALYIDGYGNAGISTAIVYLFTDGIRLQFDKNQIDLSYDAIEVLTVTAEREITALRTFVLGPVLAAAFKKETKVLVKACGNTIVTLPSTPVVACPASMGGGVVCAPAYPTTTTKTPLL